MRELPSYDALRSRDPRHLNGVLHECDDHSWDAILDALRRLPRSEPRDRPPTWLDSFVDRELRSMSTSSWAHRFHEVRLLERLGLVSPAHDDTYVLAFVAGFGRSVGRDAGPGKVALLAEDPELRDELLWRLFEVEGGGEVSLANMDRFFGGDPWQAVFRRLTEDGTLPRERVLVCCLEALQRDFNHYRAAWFSATYNALGPTVDELARHQPHLTSLLGSPLAASVSFSVRHLKTVAKAQLLDDAVLPALEAAVLVRSKGTALDALRLAAVHAGKQRQPVVAIATTALGHENADVQRAASALLAKLGEEDAVLSEAASLAPSVQRELGVRVAPDAQQVRQQPLEDPAPAVSAEDLLERSAALLEGGFTASEFEAVLAGLAVFGTPQLLKPLHKRATAVARRSAERDPRSLVGSIARMLLDGFGLAQQPVGGGVEEQRLVLARLDEVADAIAGRRERRTLIATPDRPGWRLSRAAFLARGAGGTPYPSDLVAALLRLDPTDRAELSAALPSVADHPALTEPVPRTLVGELRTFTWTDKGRDRTGTYLDWGLGLPDETSAGLWLPVVAATRPHDAERFASLTIKPLLDAANYPTVHHDVPVLLDILAKHPGGTGPLTALTLAAGLVAGRGDQRLHAADAFSDLVPSGRVPAGDVARTLAQYADGWTITRAADSLRQAAQTPGTAAAVIDVLTALIPLLGTAHRGIGSLLDVLHEESLRVGRPVTDPALRATLTSFSGSSKAARTARLLLG